MCGIAGRVNYLSQRPVDPAVVRGMCDLHRAPRTRRRGTCTSGAPSAWAIAAWRSSTSAQPATQPMSDRGRPVWITFNGEIYNFLELRRELEARGHRFAHADATPRSSSTPTRSTASTASRGCAGMFALRHLGRAAASGCSWRATGSARSRCLRADADGIAASRPS